MSEKGLTHGIRFKDKIGYAMGGYGRPFNLFTNRCVSK